MGRRAAPPRGVSMSGEVKHPILRLLRKLASAAEAHRATDGQLLQRFVSRRDAAAFEVLVHRHGAMVWRVCRQLLPEAHAASLKALAARLDHLPAGATVRQK